MFIYSQVIGTSMSPCLATTKHFVKDRSKTVTTSAQESLLKKSSILPQTTVQLNISICIWIKILLPYKEKKSQSLTLLLDFFGLVLWTFRRWASGISLDRHRRLWCILMTGDKVIHKTLPSCSDFFFKGVYYASASFALKAKQKIEIFQMGSLTIQIGSELESSRTHLSAANPSLEMCFQSPVPPSEWHAVVCQVLHMHIAIWFGNSSTSLVRGFSSVIIFSVYFAYL